MAAAGAAAVREERYDFLQTSPDYGRLDYSITKSDKSVPDEFKKGREEWETIKIVVSGDETRDINLYCPPSYKTRYFIQFGLYVSNTAARLMLIDNHGQPINLSYSIHNLDRIIVYDVDDILYPFQLPDKLIDLYKKTSNLPNKMGLKVINIPESTQMFGYILKMIPQMIHDRYISNLPMLPPSPGLSNNNQNGGKARKVRKTRKMRR
jgi:hypothetical protein